MQYSFHRHQLVSWCPFGTPFPISLAKGLFRFNNFWMDETELIDVTNSRTIVSIPGMNQDKFCPVFEQDFCLSSFVGLVDHVGEEEVFDKSW